MPASIEMWDGGHQWTEPTAAQAWTGMNNQPWTFDQTGPPCIHVSLAAYNQIMPRMFPTILRPTNPLAHWENPQHVMKPVQDYSWESE